MKFFCCCKEAPPEKKDDTLEFFSKKIDKPVNVLKVLLKHLNSSCSKCKQQSLATVTTNEEAPGYANAGYPVDQIKWHTHIYLLCLTCKRIESQFLIDSPGENGHEYNEKPRFDDQGSGKYM